MFKQIIFIVLIISQWSLVRSQTISRQVISNGGGTLSGGGNQITFNIGETVIPSFGVGSILMTQGFEQPGEQITTGVVSLINCEGSSFTVPFTSVDIIAGNVYTAQLSNALGSFASPVNIGTLVGNGSSGSINVTIPLNTPPGNGYRIRVVGSMPQTIGIANSNGSITVIQRLEYSYVKAEENLPYQNLFPLVDGQVIAQSNFPTSIKVKPLCSDVAIESVKMTIVGPFVNWTSLQSYQHFALFDNSNEIFNGQIWPPGSYSLTVTGYSQKFGYGGVTYGPVVTTFTIVGNAPTVSMPNVTGTEFCAGSSVNVGFNITGTFALNNQFAVILSDSSGSFNVTSDILGNTLDGNPKSYPIPNTVTGGNNYKIKVVASNPATSNYSLVPIKIHPVNLNLVSPTNDFGIATTTKKAVEAITATNKINSPAKIGYQAGKSIQLNAGFEAKLGSVFIANIGGCSN